ncbi:MAG: hypothetical protein ALECFALPRED_008161 [Alectoria fallacina]|uniref:Uncharacterized protein n=1 Tax=Alectoria fallacina TaxID=1903189 RepID=A0A8H3PFZ3_9LECA|nr:MAG: hypothetical protein ALECFALPRED_008161 [Alectoria fallacina]
MPHFKRLGSTNVLNASRFFSQRQASRNTTQDDKLVFSRHLVQPRPDNFAEKYENSFRLFWNTRSSKLAKNLAPHHGLSATQKWLAAVAAAVNVVPKNRVKLEFPAGDIAPIPRPPGPTPKRTEKDRQRVEAVLKVRISSLAKIVSPEMMDSIKHSPYYAHDENKVVLRWHQHWTRGANGQQCFRNLNLFIRNVANEIVYRENSIAADEMVREQGKINDLRPVVVSEAESKAMAWNLKKPFNRQMKKRQENGEPK